MQERLRDDKPLNKYNRDTFYSQDQASRLSIHLKVALCGLSASYWRSVSTKIWHVQVKGYTDYPFFKVCAQEFAQI